MDKGGLACCSPWGRRESDPTGRLNSSRELGLSVPHRAVLTAGQDSVSTQDTASGGEGQGLLRSWPPSPTGISPGVSILPSWHLHPLKDLSGDT